MGSSDTDLSKVWVLLSGGLDSAACVAFYRSQDCNVQALHVDYAQPAAIYERAAAEAIANHYRISYTLLQWSGSRKFSDGEIIGRNAFLFFAALLEIAGSSGILATGIHAGTPYVDCSPEFLYSTQSLFDKYCDGRIRLAAPFIDWSKVEIWDYSVAHKVPVDLTRSCERGTFRACGKCLSCRDRRALHAMQVVNNSA